MGRPVRSGARGDALAREFGSLAVLFASRNGPVRVTANGRDQPLQPRSAPGLLLEPLAEGWFLTAVPTPYLCSGCAGPRPVQLACTELWMRSTAVGGDQSGGAQSRERVGAGVDSKPCGNTAGSGGGEVHTAG